MKVCSFCQKCYDDQIAVCVSEGHGSLNRARHGNCMIVRGYRIDTRLESSSPVELYRATHLASEKCVFIRFIQPGDSFSHVEKELQSFSQLNHPSLARLIEFGRTSDDELFVVLEDFSGISLSEYLKDMQPLTEQRAIEIIRQIAEGLEELHGAGLIHKAINPSNIYFTSSAFKSCPVKLNHVDFGGIVQDNAVESANGLEVNTDSLLYFSPEQFTENEIGFKSDLYSLGAVFYEMLVGHPPVELPDPLAIISYNFNESDVRNLPIELRGLIVHSLKEAFQKRLELRPQKTANFVRQLRHIEQIANRSKNEVLEAAVSVMNGEKDEQMDKKIPKPTEIELFRKSVIMEVEEEAVEVYVYEKDDAFEESERDAERVNTFSGDSSKYDKPISDKKVAYSAENFVVLNADIDETAAPDDIIQEFTDWEDAEFVIEPVEEDMVSLVRVNPLANPARSDSSRAFVYLAGVLITAVFGGIFTAGFFEWQGASITSNINRATTNVEQKADTTAKSSELARVVEPEDEMPDGEELPDSIIEESDEITSVVAASLKRSPSSRVSKNSIRKPVKAKTRRKSSTKRKQNVPADNLTAKTRPRWVQNVVIYY